MGASASRTRRRRRYTRQTLAEPVTLTPLKVQLLRKVGDYGLASLPQLAALVCPSAKSARRHLRELFDAGLVEVIPVARVALADPFAANDASLLYGSAPNIYTLTREGRKVLREVGWVDPDAIGTRLGPKNSLFLAHELAVRDVRVWLELAARQHPGHRLAAWHDGSAAELDLKRDRAPKWVRPDAWFIYRIGTQALVGLVEADRGTEYAGHRWREKLAAYRALYQSGRLKEVTGYLNARVLVVTATPRQRDRLADLIAKRADGHPNGRTTASLADRFWLAERTVLQTPNLSAPHWRQPGSRLLKALLPRD